MENNIAITDIYEHAVKNLHLLSAMEQSIIAQNIGTLEWIDDLISKNTQLVFEKLIKEVAINIDNKTAPVDIMCMSALIYKGKEAGYNVQPLFDSMHRNGDWLFYKQSQNK